MGVLWIQADGSLGDGVCCSFTAPVFEIMRADGTDQLGWPWSTYRRAMGLLVWPALGAHKLLGSNPDFLLWLNLAMVLLAQVLLYDLGRRMARPLAGLVAAGLFPMIPAVTLMTRRWDAMIPSTAAHPRRQPRLPQRGLHLRDHRLRARGRTRKHPECTRDRQSALHGRHLLPSARLCRA